MLDAARGDDAAEWLGLWNSWPSREVFAHPAYVNLYSTPHSRALCATWSSGNLRVLYPFLLRDLTVEPCWRAGLPPASDIITPYGYGGPFAWGGGDLERIASDFWACFGEWVRDNRVVSEFIRFSLFEDALLKYPVAKECRLSNVVLDLTASEEHIWQQYEHKVRKNVKAAQRNGVSVEGDPSGSRLEEFLAVYQATMERRTAEGRYFFPRSYFEGLHQALPGQFVYFHCLHRGTVISAELVLVSAENVYSFLGGTDSRHFHLRPNDLLKHEIIRWAKSKGKRRYVLGGGYQERDGIYRYKLSFAPNGEMPFFVGARIFNREVYESLVNHRMQSSLLSGCTWTPAPGFFPAYRA